MKPHRYYEVIDNIAYIYDQPYTSNAQSVSIVSASDIAYFRRNFNLSRIWGETAPINNQM